jgi:hypothetical protein
MWVDSAWKKIHLLHFPYPHNHYVKGIAQIGLFSSFSGEQIEALREKYLAKMHVISMPKGRP